MRFEDVGMGFIAAVGGNIWVMNKFSLTKSDGTRMYSSLQRLPMYLMTVAAAFYFWYQNKNNPQREKQSSFALGYGIGGIAMTLFRVGQEMLGVDTTVPAPKTYRF